MRTWFRTMGDPRFNLITRAYQNLGLWNGIYSKIRIALCPLLDIETALPDNGTLMDVGCGTGLLLQWLALGKKYSKYHLVGLEIDSKRIALGKQVNDSLQISGNLDLRVEYFGKDSTEEDLSAVVFVDVLHHMDYELQKTMIMQSFYLLKDGGILLIKDVGTTPFIKYYYNYLFDAMTKITRITKGKIGYYRAQDEWMLLLSECGFQPSIIDVKHIDFAPHIIIVGKK